YLKAVANLKAVRAEYETAQKELKDKKAELEALSAQLLKDIDEAAAVISSLQSDINANADVLAELAAQDKALQNEINAKIKELNAQQQQQQQQGRPAGSGKLSVWPSYTTYITSVQGNRVHPVTGQYGTHGGTDIGAGYGSAIYASGGGTVVTAYNDNGYNGGYGNYVIIDHGGGLQTLYAHMSVCSVSVGQSVSAGQVIGYVGTTGRVTGAHLHFEVWANGARQDPQSYFPGLSYSYSSSAWGG
ncbi:MAG: M23 family metallopeptidase, partial [Bacillota bacterium]|nr:M23 family metallopeptidase [Bacillota bacterium]